jgi:hypothetical protein
MVVEVVGARPIGQASAAAGKTSATSAARAKVLSARPIMPISGRLKRLECAIKSANSGVSPELDKASGNLARHMARFPHAGDHNAARNTRQQTDRTDETIIQIV